MLIFKKAKEVNQFLMEITIAKIFNKIVILNKIMKVEISLITIHKVKNQIVV